MPDHGRGLLAALLGLLASLGADRLAANDIQPRLFTNVPVGTNFVTVAYTRSEGNVTVDPSVALDVTAELDTFLVSYSRAFGLFGKSATVTAAVPYADLTLSGVVDDEFVTARGDEMPDPKLRLAINLAGAPALTKEEFAAYRQRTIVGFNITVTPPLGDYRPERLVNFGANRWSVSPELGVSHRTGRFTLEAAGTLVFFSDNDEFLVNSTLKQDPVAIVRANVLYHFDRPGTWAGIGTLYLRGGETTVDGADRQDLQVRSRTGAVFSLPLGRRHNLQLMYSTGVTTRIGADFDNFGVRYSVRF